MYGVQTDNLLCMRALHHLHVQASFQAWPRPDVISRGRSRDSHPSPNDSCHLPTPPFPSFLQRNYLSPGPSTSVSTPLFLPSFLSFSPQSFVHRFLPLLSTRSSELLFAALHLCESTVPTASSLKHASPALSECL